MRPAHRLLSIAALGIVAVLLARESLAASYWPSAFERPAGVLVNGQLVLHEVVGYGEGNSWVASKRTQSDWQALPAPVSTFYIYTGVVGASLTDAASRAAWGGQAAVYAVGGDNHLYQCNYAVGSATCIWRDVTGMLPTGMSLGGNGGLAVGWDAYDREMFVEFVQAYNGTNYSGHLWQCTLATSGTSVCQWFDASCITPGCPNVSQSSSGKISVAVDTAAPERNYPGYPDVETYIISPDGHLRRWRAWDAAWDPTIPLPPTPSGTTVDFVGIQAWSVADASWNGPSYAAVAGWNHADAGDTLQLATNATGTSWTWSHLSGGPANTLSYSPGNVAEAMDGTWTRIWVSDLSGGFWRCSLGSASCSTWDSYGSPPSQVHAPYGNDRIGGGSFAYGSAGYVSGTLGATARYLYAVDTAGATPEWQNHLTLRDGVVTLMSGGTFAEFSMAEYDGTVLLTGQRWDTSVTVGLFRSTNEGSSWPPPTYPFGSGAGVDIELAFDAAGTAYAEWVGGIATSTDRGGTWTSMSMPFGDRPSMAADWRVPGRVYVESGTPTGNPTSPTNFRYCTSGAACAMNPGNWCGPYPYPTSSRSYVSLGGDGALYFVTDGSALDPPTAAATPVDPACPPPSGYNASVGVRRIVNVASLSPPPGCSTPTWSNPPECLYYYAVETNLTTRFHNAGAHSGISVTIDAPRDSSSGPLVLITGYTDTIGGTCSSASVHCRAEVFATWRNSSGSWYADRQASMLRVNQDGGTDWVDHILGTPLAFDYGRYNASWMDWREDSLNDRYYHLYSSTITAGALVGVAETRWADAEVSWGYWWGASWGGLGWPGDVQRSARARDHGHQVGSRGSTGATEAAWPTTGLVSPHIR